MEEINSNSLNKSNVFIGYIIIFLKYKKLILFGSTFVLLISIVLYFFVFDFIYYSSATIKSSGKSPSFLMGLNGLGDFGGLGDIVGGTSSSKELSYYMEVLSSRRSLEPLIVKFKLMERDKHQFIEDAIKAFKKGNLVLDFDKLSGLLTIGVNDKDPVLAKEMVEFLINELNKINIELSVLNAKNNREFVEKRYEQARIDLSNSEDSLKSFQMIYGVAPDLKIKASAQSVYTLDAELKAEEIKLDVMRQILSSDQPEIKSQETKVNSIKNTIQQINSSTDINDILSLGNSPVIAISYLRLQREVEIQTKILTFLLPVYEQAKIEEKKETPTILVLDSPYIAEKKIKPKRLTMVLLSTICAFFVLTISVICYEIYIKGFIKILKNI